MNQINKKHFYSRQKGRALTIFVTSREGDKVNRKRKENTLRMRFERGSKRISKEEIKANE